MFQVMLALYYIGMLRNVAVYPEEEFTFYGENEDGVYGVEPFFISYSILELPFEIASSILFSAFATYAIGLPKTGMVFGIAMFVCYSLISCGESIGIIFNTLFPSTGFAVSLTSSIISLELVMCGVLQTDLSGVLDAINHVNPGKWTVAAMASYTLRGQTCTCDASQMVGGKRLLGTGEEVLRLYNLYPGGSKALLWFGIVVIGYRLLAYIILKTVRHDWNIRGLWLGHKQAE